MRMISGKKAAELSAMYPSSAFFSDPSIHMEYASWKKGEILVSAFDMPKYLIFLFSGTVKISAYRDDGSEFVLPTEENIVIGDIQLMTGKPSPFYAEAVTDLACGIVDIERYGERLKNDVMFLRGTLSMMSERMEMMLRPGIDPESAEERVLSYIGNICRGRMENITHASQALHLSRRHVHRILSSLVDRGLIIHDEYGIYRFPDSI